MILAARRINRPRTPSPAGIGPYRRRSPIAPSYCLYVSCPMTLSPLPAARLPNNHASLIGGNFTLNVSST